MMQPSEQIIDIKNLSTVGKEKVPCGSKDLIERARAQNKSEIIDQYKKDYPIGPHDQPQSMCPAFGSLRVGLRMNRVATILSGSACCVYGLTFTSHFYGARRSVGYVPFNSETLVTGKLFEDIKESVEKTADPDKLDAIVVINLCVPTASGVPLQLLPKVINGVRIIGIDVPGFGVPTHAEAKDILASAMLKFSKTEIASGPVKKSLQQRKGLPLVTLVGEVFPLDPMSISSMLEPLDLEVGAIVPTRQWRELYTAFEGSLVAGLHPFYTSTFREFESVGKPILSSAPVGYEGTASWLERLGNSLNLSEAKVGKSKELVLPLIKESLKEQKLNGSITLSGYEGSELLVARLLIESGLTVKYVGTACPRTKQSMVDEEWLKQNGVSVKFRASLESDLQAIDEYEPDLAIGTTPVVQHAKEKAIPSLYFTNLISARPLMGNLGIGSVMEVVKGAMNNGERFKKMKKFFSGVGEGQSSGVWHPYGEKSEKFKNMISEKKQQGSTKNKEQVKC
jgi:chlorophyllide a reductase subunit Y